MTRTTGNGDPRVIEGINHANTLHSQGETAAAVHYLSTLIEEFPQAAGLHGYIAMFLTDAGRLREAIEYAKQATQLAPTSEKASFVLFVALSKAEQYIEALDEVKRLLVLRPSEEYSRLVEEFNPIEDEPQTP